MGTLHPRCLRAAFLRAASGGGFHLSSPQPLQGAATSSGQGFPYCSPAQAWLPPLGQDHDFMAPGARHTQALPSWCQLWGSADRSLWTGRRGSGREAEIWYQEGKRCCPQVICLLGFRRPGLEGQCLVCLPLGVSLLTCVGPDGGGVGAHVGVEYNLASRATLVLQGSSISATGDGFWRCIWSSERVYTRVESPRKGEIL